MARKRRHHYLPICYLKGFCGANKKVWTYKKGSFIGPHANPPSSTALVRDLYQIKGNEIDVNRIEDYFASDIEGPATEPLRKLISKMFLSDGEKFMLSLFFAALVVRSPHFIQQLDDKLSGVIREIVIQDAGNKKLFHGKYQRLYSDMTKAEFEQYRLAILDPRCVEIRINRDFTLIYILTFIRLFGKILSGRKWCLMETDYMNPFVTSDNLASCMNLDISSYRISQASEVANDNYNYIPISSELCLIFHIDDRLKEYEVIYINEKNSTIFSKINQRTFRGSHKYVFACADSNSLKKCFEDIISEKT